MPRCVQVGAVFHRFNKRKTKRKKSSVSKLPNLTETFNLRDLEEL